MDVKCLFLYQSKSTHVCLNQNDTFLTTLCHFMEFSNIKIITGPQSALASALASVSISTSISTSTSTAAGDNGEDDRNLFLLSVQ